MYLQNCPKCKKDRGFCGYNKIGWYASCAVCNFGIESSEVSNVSQTMSEATLAWNEACMEYRLCKMEETLAKTIELLEKLAQAQLDYNS